MRPASALALALTTILLCAPAHADEAALAVKIDQLSSEVEALRAELKELKAQRTATASNTVTAPGVNSTPTEAKAAAGTTAAATNDTGAATPLPYTMAPGSPFASNAGQEGPATTFFGYGELNYQNYPRNRSQTQADLARAVIGLGHRFDDKTRFVSEFEWEHAVTSADDQGESEVEQFYVERSFTPQLAGRAGLFLIPSGMLNTAHEPTQYFGVTRNFVETSIIPTTWREGGIGVTGVTDAGLTWDVGVTTGFNLAKWDPTSDEGKLSPLGSIHQELQLAKAADLSGYRGAQLARLSWSADRRQRVLRQGGPGSARFPVAERRRHAGRSACTLDAGAVRSVGALCARPHQRHGALQPDDRRQSNARAVRISTAGTCRAHGTHGSTTTISSLPFVALRTASTPDGNTQRLLQGSRQTSLPTEGVTTSARVSTSRPTSSSRPTTNGSSVEHARTIASSSASGSTSDS